MERTKKGTEARWRVKTKKEGVEKRRNRKVDRQEGSPKWEE